MRRRGFNGLRPEPRLILKANKHSRYRLGCREADSVCHCNRRELTSCDEPQSFRRRVMQADLRSKKLSFRSDASEILPVENVSTAVIISIAAHLMPHNFISVRIDPRH